MTVDNNNPTSEGNHRPRTFWPVRLMVGMLTACLVVGLLAIPLPGHWSLAWRAKILDLGHIPLFALATWLLCWVFAGRWRLACVLLMIAVPLLEVVQRFLNRSANVEDAIRGWIGIAIALMVMWAIKARPQERIGRGAFALLVTLVLLIWPTVEAWPIFADLHHARVTFPVLADFRSDLELARWRQPSSKIVRESAEIVAKNDSMETTTAAWRNPTPGVITFLPGKNSDIQLRPPVDDWSGFKHLVIEYESADSFDLVLSIVDYRKEFGWSHRFNDIRRIRPGRFRWSIDLQKAQNQPVSGPLKLEHVRWFWLSAPNGKTNRQLRVHNIYLE